MKRYLLILFLLIFSNLTAQDVYFKLPVPTGQYSIGTTKFYVQDVYREEIYTEDKFDYREFMVRAWYPAKNTSGKSVLKYLEGYNIDTLKYYWDMFDIPKKLFNLIGQVETNSYIEPPISENSDTYPVIIFSHGYGLGVPELYTFISENLASHGYIVLSITHPYESVEIDFPGKPTVYLSEDRANQVLQENLMEYAEMKKVTTFEERVKATKGVLENSPIADESIKEWTKDAEFLLSQMDLSTGQIPAFLREKIDMGRIGALGHSFGGAMAGQLGMNDTRIRAVMNMDGFQYGDVLGKELHFNYAMVYSAFNNNMNDAILTSTSLNLHMISIPRTMHFAFTDMAAYPEAFNKAGFVGDVNSDEFIEMLNDLILNYFNVYLKGNTEEFPSPVLMNEYHVEVKTLRK